MSNHSQYSDSGKGRCARSFVEGNSALSEYFRFPEESTGQCPLLTGPMAAIFNTSLEQYVSTILLNVLRVLAMFTKEEVDAFRMHLAEVGDREIGRRLGITDHKKIKRMYSRVAVALRKSAPVGHGNSTADSE